MGLRGEGKNQMTKVESEVANDPQSEKKKSYFSVLCGFCILRILVTVNLFKQSLLWIYVAKLNPPQISARRSKISVDSEFRE